MIIIQPFYFKLRKYYLKNFLFYFIFFQQQYSPMVMRKFKKSIDEPAGENPEIGLNSPRLTRRNRGGSF